MADPISEKPDPDSDDKKIKKFSLRSRRFNLTFKSHLPKQALLERIAGVVDPRRYRIWHEVSPQGYTHTHAIIWAKKQPNIKNCHVFCKDPEDSEHIHPHIKPVNTDAHWKNCCHYNKDKSQEDGSAPKDPDPLENFTDDACSATYVQIDNILGKRSMRDVMFDDDTSGIYKERRYWAKEVFLSKRRDRTKAPEVYVFWGQPRTGKTRYCWDTWHDFDTCSISGHRFVLGYRGQKNVIFDDFNPKSCPVELLLKLTDRYPYTIDVKGSEVEWCPEVICFTSNVSPMAWYPDHPGWEAAFRGRCKQIKKFQSGV